MFKTSNSLIGLKGPSPSLFSYSPTKVSSFHDSQFYPTSVITDESFGEHFAIDILTGLDNSLQDIPNR